MGLFSGMEVVILSKKMLKIRGTVLRLLTLLLLLLLLFLSFILCVIEVVVGAAVF